jgi:hypothetical protein
VADCDPGADVKDEKFEKGAGEGLDAGTWPLALFPCVTEDSNAGPGMSGDC